MIMTIPIRGRGRFPVRRPAERERDVDEGDEGGAEEPRAREPGAETLAEARELARVSAQDALTACVYLLMVMVGVVSLLTGGGTARPRPLIVSLVLLALSAAMAGCFAIALTLVIRSRRMFARALAETRRTIGAPLHPSPPWTPHASTLPLAPAVFEGELRRLLSAASRCCTLAGQAVAWAAWTGLLFVCWTLFWIGVR
jgi:hypothetical protein